MEQERRRSARVRCVLPIRIYPHGDVHVIETLTKDLSVSGLRAISPIPKRVTTPVLVELVAGIGDEPIRLRAEVVWFESLPHSEQFHLGLIFQDTPPRAHILLSGYIDAHLSARLGQLSNKASFT